uniref:F-box domain-containing protein n=1 Tax=Mycena chlorophos TaxID=658473 RepID=A0ABQ0LH80_MYCCL|nr:predicted protein [Mycena chlorophos]
MATQTARLPPELERDIFERAARLNQHCIPRLLRVARRVFEWIEPLLYRKISLGLADGEDFEKRAGRVALSSKSQVYLARSVRQVVLDYMPEKAIHEVLQKLPWLTGVTHISLYCQSHPDMLPVLAQLPIRRLGCHLRRTLGPQLLQEPRSAAAHPLFRALTHLCVHEVCSVIQPQVAELLPLLPVLTHLALFLPQRESIVPRSWELLLERCLRLEVLVALGILEEGPACGAEDMGGIIKDPRLVRCFPSVAWNEGTSDEPNYWTVAEDFIS